MSRPHSKDGVVPKTSVPGASVRTAPTAPMPISSTSTVYQAFSGSGVRATSARAAR